MQSVIYRKEERTPVFFNPGKFRITVCDGSAGNIDCGGGQPLIGGAHISVYKYQGSALAILEDNRDAAGNLLPDNPITIEVPALPGYSIHVQKDGYFPFHLDNRQI